MKESSWFRHWIWAFRRDCSALATWASAWTTCSSDMLPSCTRIRFWSSSSWAWARFRRWISICSMAARRPQYGASNLIGEVRDLALELEIRDLGLGSPGSGGRSAGCR